MADNQPIIYTERREIRIFISSTFRDMMQERDLLVKKVFPALRQICAKRFVTFIWRNIVLQPLV